MSVIIPVKHAIYDKNRFSKVIDTQFKELYTTEPATQEVTVSDFFALYDSLFFIIPKEGDIESHRYILDKEANYLGVRFADDVDVNTLLQEITDLRTQLITLETENIKLSSQTLTSTLSTTTNQ